MNTEESLCAKFTSSAQVARFLYAILYVIVGTFLMFYALFAGCYLSGCIATMLAVFAWRKLEFSFLKRQL